MAPVGFNGAAPARARNRQQRDALVKQMAASTGPRPRGRGISLLLLPLAQAHNTSIAVGSTDSIALMLMPDTVLSLLAYCKAFMSCECLRGFRRHLADR